MLLMVANWIERRHQTQVLQLLWSLCVLADPQADPELVQQALAASILHQCQRRHDHQPKLPTRARLPELHSTSYLQL